MLRRYLLWPAAVLGFMLFLLIAVIVLGPAVARAQFVSEGGATIPEVLAALVGQNLDARSYSASATSGAGYSCTAVTPTCFDPGPGAHNGICTNVAGDIALGCGSTSVVVRVGEGCSITTNQVTCDNGAFNFNGSILRNNIGGEGGTVHVLDPQGLMVNNTTPIKGVLMRAVPVDIGDVVDQCDDVTATVLGVEEGDFVLVTPNEDLAASNFMVGGARVTNAGTDEVTFRACDVANGNDNPASVSLAFLVMRP